MGRFRTFALLAVLAAAVASAQAGPASASSKAAASATTIRAAINAVRGQHGLRPLHASWRLARAAGQHSQEMAQVGYFEHSSADGTSFWKRIQRYYGSSGYRRWSVGENLLWSSGAPSAQYVVGSWMQSAGHRENLLSRSWRKVGISVFHTGLGLGVFSGLDVTIVTADFGVRY